MNRLERLSAILVRLQSRSVITAYEIAEQFGISQRTVYRDIRALEESGIPICGEAGIGYSLVDGYKLPPLMFTTEEAISFLMAEKLVANLTDGDTYSLYTAGMDKIRAVLRKMDQNIMENFDAHIHVSHYGSRPPHNNIPILQPLLRSILEKQCITIEYKAGYNQKITERVIEPLGVFFRENHWYIVSWCQLREDYRTFKLSRIQQIFLENKQFTRLHPDLKELMNSFHNDEEECDICIHINSEFLQFIGLSKYMHGLYEEEFKDGYVVQRYRTNSPEFFCRWFLSFADNAVIIGPEKIKERVKELWNSMIGKMQ